MSWNENYFTSAPVINSILICIEYDNIHLKDKQQTMRTSLKMLFFPFQVWDSSSTHSSDINAFWGVRVCMCQLSATFMKGHSLPESFVLCNRFIQILNTQLWAQPPSKAAVITQHHFPATVEENAPIIHNIIISFPWQLQKDCTISNRLKPGQQWSFTERSLPPAPNKAAIRWWLFFTCPPTGRNISQPVKSEVNQTSNPPSPPSTATVPPVTITGLTSFICDMFGSWTSVNHLKVSVWMCSSKTQQLISTCHKQALYHARVGREWESSALVFLRYVLGYFVRLWWTTISLE